MSSWCRSVETGTAGSLVGGANSALAPLISPVWLRASGFQQEVQSCALLARSALIRPLRSFGHPGTALLRACLLVVDWGDGSANALCSDGGLYLCVHPLHQLGLRKVALTWPVQKTRRVRNVRDISLRRGVWTSACLG